MKGKIALALCAILSTCQSVQTAPIGATTVQENPVSVVASTSSEQKQEVVVHAPVIVADAPVIVEQNRQAKASAVPIVKTEPIVTQNIQKNPDITNKSVEVPNGLPSPTVKYVSPPAPKPPQQPVPSAVNIVPQPVVQNIPTSKNVQVVKTIQSVQTIQKAPEIIQQVNEKTQKLVQNVQLTPQKVVQKQQPMTQPLILTTKPVGQFVVGTPKSAPSPVSSTFKQPFRSAPTTRKDNKPSYSAYRTVNAESTQRPSSRYSQTSSNIKPQTGRFGSRFGVPSEGEELPTVLMPASPPPPPIRKGAQRTIGSDSAGNRIEGNAVWGDGSSNGNYNSIMGDRNVISGGISGNRNSIGGNRASGDWNSVGLSSRNKMSSSSQLEGSSVLGDGASLNDPNDTNIINGVDNQVNGYYNTVDGDSNQLDGHVNSVTGDGNRVMGSGNTIMGTGNIISSQNSYVQGCDNSFTSRRGK